MRTKLSLIFLTVILVLEIIAAGSLAVRDIFAQGPADPKAEESAILTETPEEIEHKDIKLKVEDKKKKKLRIVGSEQKQFTGELISLYPRGNPVALAVADPKGNMDYAFDIDPNAKIMGKRSLSELQLGDTITVMCNEIRKVRGEGAEEENLRDRRAVIIKFVSRKQEGSLVSQ